MSEFLIPKRPADSGDSIDWFGIFDTYIEAVNKEVKPKPDGEVFYTGRLVPNGRSRFINSNLGIKEIRNVPTYIANWLKLDDPEKYTGNFLFANICSK